MRSLDLIVAERQIIGVLDCRVIWWSSGALLLAFKGSPPPVTVDVDFEDRCMVDEAIHRGQRHGGIWKNVAPCPEWLIGRYQGGTAFVAGTDEFEQNRCFRLILADIGEVIEDQQMETIEPVNCGFEPEFATRDLEFLHQVGGSGE